MNSGGKLKLPFACPGCGGDSRVYSSGPRLGGYQRHRRCAECNRQFVTLQPEGHPEQILRSQIKKRKRQRQKEWVCISRHGKPCEYLATCRSLAPDQPVKCETLLPFERGKEWDNDVDNRQPAITAEIVMWLRAA